MTMEKKYKELKSLLAEVSDLGKIGAVIGWDQSTQMPPGGAAARGRQRATLSRLIQQVKQ